MRLLGTKEVAKVLNLKETQVKDYLSSGKLKGQKVSNSWVVLEDDLKNFSRSPVGRPKEIDNYNQILAMYLNGLSHSEIQEKANLPTLQKVRDIVHIIHQEWKAEYVHDLHEHKLKELAKLDKLESELWALYERSKKVKLKTTTKAKEINGLTLTEASETEMDMIGDVRVLKQINIVCDSRRRLLGLDKIKIDIKYEEKRTLELRFKGMSDEELSQYIISNS